jgi:hypothetical protein
VSGKPIILCEGDGDVAFLSNLVRNRSLRSFDIRKPEEKQKGADGFFVRLDGLALEVGIDRCPFVVVVADNDVSPSDEFNRIADQVARAGWQRPTRPREEVTFQNSSLFLPPVIVLMLPWDNLPGCMESLCYISASAERPTIAAIVEQFVKDVGAESWRLPQLTKLKLRCLIASSCPGDPNTGLQYAWSAKPPGRPDNLIPLQHECFNQLAEYLATLRHGIVDAPIG